MYIENKIHVLNRAITIFGSKEVAEEWLNTPIKVLSNRSPLDLLATEDGTKEVNKALNKIEEGEFS